MKQIKGMTKVANGKGAVFDAPEETIHEFR